MIKDLTIIAALNRLRPNTRWYFKGEQIYANLCWQDTEYTKPSENELLAEEKLVIAEREAIAYKKLRAKEYPPITDYLDGIVKGDQEQIAAYIAACQAVKTKYPKPE